MSASYSRSKAEQDSGIPWSELIDMMMSAPEAKPYGWETMSAEELARWQNDPSVVLNDKQLRTAVKRYRMGRTSQISPAAGSIIFGELESRGFIRRDQDGSIYAMQKDATFRKVM